MERGSEKAVESSESSQEEAEVDCGEAVERLYHYLDGELTEERRAKIQQHLDACHSCVEAYDFEAELRQLIANRCKDHVPPSLLARVKAVLAEEESRQGATRAD